MKTYQGTTRPVADIDYERFPELKLIVDACAQCEPDAVLDLANSPLADFIDDLVVVEAVGGGDYRYLHYGHTVSSDAGLNMTGKLTSEFSTGIGKKFALSYNTALRQNRVMYSVNKAAVTHTTHSWQRLIVPFPGKRGVRPGRVLSFVRRLVWVEDILADFARDTNFLGGTLEPVVEEDGVSDFILLSLTEIDEVLGEHLVTLAELYGRPLTACETSSILNAADGESAIKMELPTSKERFGRRFFLTVVGGSSQPIFELIDSTDMLEARNEAEEKRQTMEDFARVASDWLWETDANHVFTYMSDAVESVSGRPASFFIGRSRFSYAPYPDNVERFDTHRKTLDAHEPFRGFIYRGETPSGALRWYRVNGAPRFDADGSFLGFRGSGSDITAEVLARESSEQRKAIMEDFAGLASDWLWETDASDTFTYMSAAIEEQTGAKPERYIGVNWYDLKDVPENVEIFAAHRAVREARKPFSDFVYKGFCDDGRALWIRANGRPIFDDAGAFAGYRGTGSNITAEVEAKRELEAQKSAMEDFANTASDWMWESDVDHKMTMLTDAVVAYAGHPVSFFIGKSRLGFADLPENKVTFERHLEDINARRPFQDLIYRIQAKDGAYRWFKVSGVPRFDELGAFCGYRGTGSDITAEVEAKRALEESQAAMQDFAKTASDWMWETDDQHVFTMMSPAIETFTGRPHTHYIGKSRYELMSAPENAEILAAHKQQIEAREPYTNFIYQVEASDGRTMWARSNGKPNFDKDGVFLGYRGTGTNITEEVEARAQAARRSEDLAEAHRLGRLGAWSYDRHSGQVTLSPEFLELTGLPPSASTMKGKRFAAFVEPTYRANVSTALRQLLHSRDTQTLDVGWTSRACGSMDLNVVARARCDARGQVYEVFGTVQDISERKRAERELEALAFHDPLTGLGNRAYFSRELNAVLERLSQRKGRAGLLLLDLDHFKEVNDTLGHAAGDDLLRRISERLTQTVGLRGRVCRLGGDEFAVILPQVTSAAEMGALASSIISAFAGTVKLREGAVHISTSIGMVMLPDQADDADQTMRFADLALYEAKSAGRNRALLFHVGLDRNVQDRVSLARDLREAIDNDALDAHFQPQVDVLEGRVSGFEALVRWNHPTRGAIPPTKFIPIAEGSRLIADLGAWMVRKTCQQGKAWLDAGGAPLQMAVNLSVAQLWHRDVETDVRQALEETGFPPELLCVELTESVFSDDALPRIKRLFASLKALGVQIALDDFGTGYSSLQYLNSLSVDKLKIDRSFVVDCDRNPEQLRLLQGIVGLGHGLGLTVVVEGVESEAELQVVCDLGCQEVQGYFFAKPKAFHEACLDAARLEAQYGFNPVLWKEAKAKPNDENVGTDQQQVRQVR